MKNLFKSKLGDLIVNKKCIIHELTVLAKVHEDNAEVIVSEIQSHIAQIHPDTKLPGLYLIDSIIRNVKGRYVDFFSQVIVEIFFDIFKEVDLDTRRKMYKLRKRWTNIFQGDLLFKLDFKINGLFADWPIAVEIAPSKKLLSLEFQKQELELKLATTVQRIAKLDHESDAEVLKESTYVVSPQLTMPFSNVKRPADETSFEKSVLKKIKSDCDEWHDDDVIEIIERRDTIEILDDDDEMTELNVSSSDPNLSATLTNNQGHVENTRKILHNSIFEIEGLEEQRIDSTTNDTYEVFQHLVKIKNESKDLAYGDDDDCFDDIGTSTVSFTDETFFIDNQDLQSIKSTQETPSLNHQSKTNPSTLTTIDGNLQFPDIATSIGANKIKINLKNNVVCMKSERKKNSRTNSCKTKKIVIRSNVQADEKSALCSMM